MKPLSIVGHGFLVSLLCVAIGCSSPQARYYKSGSEVDRIKIEKTEGLIAFNLQGALVTIAPKPTSKEAQETKAKQPETQLDALGLTRDPQKIDKMEDLKNTQAFATQADAVDSLFLLEPNDDLFTKSNMSVTYYDGRHRIKAIGTDFQDDRIKIVQALGGTFAAITPFLALDASPRAGQATLPLELPLVLDFTDPKKFPTAENRDRGGDSDWSAREKILDYTPWFYRYKFSKPQGRVFLTQPFIDSHKQNYTREFPISACVDLTLEIGKSTDTQKWDGDKVMTYVLRIPDPSYVELLTLPIKGSITTHTVCGADISSQPSKAASTFEILEAIAKQVETIWNTQQKKSQGK